jgi:hypothetical protein
LLFSRVAGEATGIGDDRDKGNVMGAFVDIPNALKKQSDYYKSSLYRLGFCVI